MTRRKRKITEPFHRCSYTAKAFPVATARYGKAHADLYSDGFWREPRLTNEIDLCRDLVGVLNAIETPDITFNSVEKLLAAMRVHMYSLACFTGADFRILPFDEEADRKFADETGAVPGETILMKPDLAKSLPWH